MGEDRISRDTQRYLVRDAAAILGISEAAVRNRLYRGTLRSVKEAGVVYVLLPAEALRDTERETERDIGDKGGDAKDSLIAELQDRVQSLEEANRENRRIIAMLASRVPELEASSAAREAPEPPTEGADRATGPPEPQPGAQRPWWRRMFGG